MVKRYKHKTCIIVIWCALPLREEFKFYDQMEEIFTRELKTDNSDGDLFAMEEAAVCEPTLEVDQQTGESTQQNGNFL